MKPSATSILLFGVTIASLTGCERFYAHRPRPGWRCRERYYFVSEFPMLVLPELEVPILNVEISRSDGSGSRSTDVPLRLTDTGWWPEFCEVTDYRCDVDFNTPPTRCTDADDVLVFQLDDLAEIGLRDPTPVLGGRPLDLCLWGATSCVDLVLVPDL